MKKIITTQKFLKDLKRSKKRGKDLQKLRKILKLLSKGDSIPPTHREHKLKGDFQDFFECHIEPDWLLIYKKKPEAIYLARMGTHADLF